MADMAMDRPSSSHSHTSLRSDSIPYPAKPVQATKTYDQIPDTLDARYLARHLGQSLTTALKEIAETRPWDPIEYLAQWLYKYSADQIQKKADAEEKYATEVEKVEAEREKIRKRRQGNEETMLVTEEKDKLRLQMEQEEKERKAREDEQKRLKELEELQKKQREGTDPYAQRPDLATVSEEADHADVGKKEFGTKKSDPANDKADEPEA